jgi:hypothetical protein
MHISGREHAQQYIANENYITFCNGYNGFVMFRNLQKTPIDSGSMTFVKHATHYVPRSCLPFASTWVHPRFFAGSVLLIFLVFVCCTIMCLYVRSSVLWYPFWFPHKYDVRFVLYLQLFVGGRMSYLRYLCLFPHTGGQHILRCVFVVFFFILLSVSLNCPLWLPLRYFLTFIY